MSLSGIRWDVIKPAIHSWIRLASELPGDRVVWWSQGQKELGVSHIRLAVQVELAGGDDWEVREQSGDNVVVYTMGARILNLEIQTHAGLTQIRDQFEPQDMLIACIRRYTESAIHRILSDAQIGVGQVSRPTFTDTIDKAAVMSLRGMCVVQLHVTSIRSETIGTFATAELNGQIL